jgi:hypothetical protein
MIYDNAKCILIVNVKMIAASSRSIRAVRQRAIDDVWLSLLDNVRIE